MKILSTSGAFAAACVLLAGLAGVPGLARATDTADDGSEGLASSESQLDSTDDGSEGLAMSDSQLDSADDGTKGWAMSDSQFGSADDGTKWLAMSDNQLGSMRGGFSVQPGLMVSFGIMRTVHINGVLASSSGFQVGELSSMTVAQAEQLGRQTAALSLVQTGTGNTFATGFQPGSPAIVIQNTLNNQKIQSITEINAVSNGMSILKGMNLNQTLNDALGAAVR